MKIRIKASRRRMDRVTLNMASMIDATFLLLAYFLVTTAISRPEDRLSPTLQTESRNASPATDFQAQRVEVMQIDGVPTYKLSALIMRDRDELASALQPLPKEAGVFVHVHGDVPVGFAVAAVQAARNAGFEQVTYVPARN